MKLIMVEIVEATGRARHLCPTGETLQKHGHLAVEDEKGQLWLVLCNKGFDSIWDIQGPYISNRLSEPRPLALGEHMPQRSEIEKLIKAERFVLAATLNPIQWFLSKQ